MLKTYFCEIITYIILARFRDHRADSRASLLELHLFKFIPVKRFRKGKVSIILIGSVYQPAPKRATMPFSPLVAAKFHL
jgi:hypothetical protein